MKIKCSNIKCSHNSVGSGNFKSELSKFGLEPTEDDAFCLLNIKHITINKNGKCIMCDNKKVKNED
jgi:hypothetical protein